MNHLAHLYLARPTVESRVGNLLGDFARGVDVDALPVAVKEGLDNHRAVDAFTDRHPEVLRAKTLFSNQRRRFAGVALDVLFDHYLIRNWSRFTQASRPVFIDESYQDLDRGQHLMPRAMVEVTQRMIRHDWLSGYEDLETIGFALDRIAERIRFPNQFGGMIEEIEMMDEELEAVFLAFFPDLLAFTGTRQQ